MSMRIFSVCRKLQIGDLFDIVKGDLGTLESRLVQLSFAILKNLNVSTVEFVNRCDIANGAMKSYQVVVSDECCDDSAGLVQ